MVEKTQKTRKKRRKTVSKSKRKPSKVVVSRGKRKSAIAIAVIKDGSSKYTINGKNADSIQNKYMKTLAYEPLSFISDISKLNVSVTVHGGGSMGQIQAARTAVANALIKFYDDKNLMSEMEKYDRNLVVEDARRVETKKYGGRKARAKRQKSYR